MTYQRGDVAVFLVAIITSISVLLLGTLSQRVVGQIQRDRQGLASQQAEQAAQSGLEHWIEELKTKGKPSLVGNPAEDQKIEETLSSSGNAEIKYVVTYEDNTGDPSIPNVVTSIGTADTTSSQEPVRRILKLEL